MKIRKLHLKNIGVFDDESIEFQPCPDKDKAEIHIFTGENGTGKTSILLGLTSAFIDLEENVDYTKIPNLLRKRFVSVKFQEITQLTNKITVVFRDKTKTSLFFRIGSFHSKLNPYQSPKSVVDELYLKGLQGYRKHVNSGNNLGQILQSGLSFAVFAFSGYRQIESETVQANYMPKDFNPLSQSLEFIKDYRKEGEITINQLVTNNISNRALARDDGSVEESKRYEAIIDAIETFIKNVTDKEIKFVLKRSPNELRLKVDGEELDFDVLPDGLRSLISWIADLLGRVDLLKWEDDLPITEKNLILFLDEIEVHLHPAWQRKVLPVVQKLFKNSQIFLSTHSPFVVNSVDDAWVYKLELKDGKAKVAEVKKTENSESVTQVLREVFDIYGLFGKDVQDKLDRLEELRDKLLSNGNNEEHEKEFLKIASHLAKEPSDQVKNIVKGELQQLSEIKGKKFSI